VIEATRQTVSSLRAVVAAIAGLRWARLGRFEPIVPVAAALVAFAWLGQLGRPIEGAPFGLSFGPFWIVATAIGLAIVRITSPALPAGRSRLGLGLVVFVVAGWLVYDLLLWQQSNHLYDLDVYLATAGRWLTGGQPYMTGPISAWPPDPAHDFFLYPPPLLPLFGLLSKLPNPGVAIGWEAFLVACAYTSFLTLGLRPGWSLALLAFPPVMIGFESGNVASFIFLLFVLAYRAGGTLVAGGLFKVQSVVPALWLVRTRRWRGLIFGLATVGVIVLVTLPIVGFDSWRAWYAGLGYRAESQPAVAEMFGLSSARYMPGPAFVAVSVAVVALASLFSGRRGLAAFGLASILASPSLWPHGFVFALPAVLMLESGAAVWLVLGVGAIGGNPWLLFYAGWVGIVAARRLPDALHPMAGTDGPWPRPLRLRLSRQGGLTGRPDGGVGVGGGGVDAPPDTRPAAGRR
jgi:hypothetical protein